MRMLFVVLTGLTLIFIITTGWYISQTVVLSIANAFIGDVTGDALNLIHLIQFVNVAWGPVFDILVVAWMIAAAQARDVESEIYR